MADRGRLLLDAWLPARHRPVSRRDRLTNCHCDPRPGHVGLRATHIRAGCAALLCRPRVPGAARKLAARMERQGLRSRSSRLRRDGLCDYHDVVRRRRCPARDRKPLSASALGKLAIRGHRRLAGIAGVGFSGGIQGGDSSCGRGSDTLPGVEPGGSHPGILGDPTTTAPVRPLASEFGVAR